MGIKQFVALILLSTMMLTGCTNSTFDKSMEEGKLALASKEYEKASGFFGLAVEEKSNNKEAKELNEGTEKIIAINKLNTEGSLEEAIKLCDEFENPNIENGLILKEVENIKKELKNQLSKIDDNNKDIEEEATQNESKESLTSQTAMEILYQKVGTDLSYEFSGDLGDEFHVYGESGSNFYCFYPSVDGMPLEGAYYVHKTTGKVYEAYPDGTINEL
ncbi:MAG: hypothetical protein RSD22_09790 [Romboutsia sp.]